MWEGNPEEFARKAGLFLLQIGGWHRKIARKLLDAITFPQHGTSGHPG